VEVPRSASRSARAAPAAALALAVAAGCGAPATVMRPIHRFEAPAEGARRAALATATLEDDTRPVLRAPRSRVVASRERAPVGSEGEVEVVQIVRGRLAEASHVVARAHLEAGPERRVSPPRLVALRRTPAGSLFAARFPVPAEWRAREVAVGVIGVPIGTEELAAIETAAVAVPAGARLEFAIGVLEPELGSDPVAFQVDACSDACETVYRAELAPARSQDRGWHDARVALDSLAGQRRRFVFRAERPTRAAPFSLPLWAHPTLYAPAERADGGASLILLSIDTLRADHLPSYGYAHETAPFIGRLAREGTLFENTVAASTATTPSHMTMFTSLPPSVHGATDGFKALPEGILTLPEWIRAQGLDTAAITEDGWIGAQQGFARGFDVFVENKSARVMVPEGQVERTFARARRWLELHRDKRFFLFLHTYQVHAPYAPPSRYAELFAPPAGEAAPTHVRQLADYDREIRYVDDELAGLFAALEALRLAERTVLVVTSDHGEEFLEHGLVSHGGHLYEESVAVPLVLRGPGIPAGRRIPTPVGHADLMPTLLEVLGLPVPAGLSGRSLRGLLDGASGELETRPVFSEAWATFQPGGPHRGRAFEPPSLAVRRGGRKLARYRSPEGTRYELYDLAADPGERTDLSGSSPDEASALRSLLEAYERESSRKAGRAAPALPALDADRERKLRALGYLE
jgi:arylsulfatase A-like enzyme